MIPHLLGRGQVHLHHTKVHVKMGIKVIAASKALMVQATCNWNTTEAASAPKYSTESSKLLITKVIQSDFVTHCRDSGTSGVNEMY